MASITSAQSWLSTATSTWVGGVVPVVWDKVTINTWHTVTLAWTHNWWDDTNTAITILGTLYASHSVNSKLTARGDVFVSMWGSYNAGTEADPIPSTITHELELNDSATMASNKWGFRTNDAVWDWQGVRLWWASKTRFTELSADAISSATTISVADVTGWKIWDKVVIETTLAQNSVTWHVYRAITWISWNDVTLSSSVVSAKPAGTKIMNLTSNVKVYGKNWNTYASYFSVRHTQNHSSTDVVEIGETEFYCSSYTSADIHKSWTLCLTWNSPSTTTDSVKRIYRPIVHNIWSISGSTVTTVTNWGWQLMQLFGNQAYRYTIVEPILSSNNHYCSTLHSWVNVDIRDLKCIRSPWLASAWYWQWPVWVTFNWWYASCLSSWMVLSTWVAVEVNDMKINWLATFWNQSAFWRYDVNNCIFWPLWDFWASNSAFWSSGSNAPINLNNCTFQATWSQDIVFTRGSTNLQNVSSQFSFFIKNKNNDVTLHQRYTYGGKQERDNFVYSNSLSSLRLDSWYSQNPNVYTSTVNVGANQTIRILWKCRYNASYGTTYPATITVSGLWITPAVYTCPTTWADTWYPVDITVTNPNSYPWTFTLTYQAQSTANTETASVWFSGITMENMVTVSRHYGFQFLNQTYQTVNPYITEDDESVVGAYTWISINHTTDTITITSPHTIEEIYDYVYYDLCQTANLAIPEYFTTDWATYTTTYNIVNNSTLSGTGTLITTGTYIWSGTTTLVVKDSVWVRCKITSWWDTFTIKWATIPYDDDITEKTIVVATNTDVSFVMWKLGYKPQIFTINSGALGGTYNTTMLNITEAVDTALNVNPIIALTSTTVDMSGYHMFFGEMELSLEQIKAVVHRLMKYENYFDAVLATSDDNIVEVRSDEIRVNKPLFTLERDASLTLADRVQLNGYINISNAVAINPLYIINPWDSDGLYVTYLTVKPWIDADYLAGKVWQNSERTLTESAWLTPEQAEQLTNTLKKGDSMINVDDIFVSI